MAKIAVNCIQCKSEKVVKMGFQSNGTPRCKCKKCGKTFQTEYLNNGAKPETKLLIIKMSLNGRGIRDISRVLGVSKDTVLSVLKKLKIFLQT
ncbi:MAG: IS1 family transposase [Candidatus Paraimprobicoccus trichonymphae]|uniref:IS1 family transposase n=1 Tax=Candidatus Paraimprobicoccus trichonymphae TaxID=3033793 RepID=A0AA48KW77_9FIRM|nr:MAG: IS1 family transposase [Candidatus Paraimprobicoccus trichonymphae]